MTLKLIYDGFNYVDFYNGEYNPNNLTTLTNVAATGANSIAETPEFGINIASGTVYSGGATSDTPTEVASAIATARTDGLSSFVRPLIDILYDQASTTYTNPQQYYVPNYTTYPADVPAGVTPATVPGSAYANGDTTNFRGFIAPSDLGHGVNAFFGSPTTAGSYDAIIVAEAKQAASDGATLFAVGTELDSLATDTDANVVSDWKTLIADVRAAAPSLKLTYSATYSTVGQVTFWNQLDYVGIDGYVPLSSTVPNQNNDNNPSLQALINGWTQTSSVPIPYSNGTPVSTLLGNMSAIDYFDTVAQQSLSKQFIFTELGYQNDTGAAADPTGGSATGVLDPSLQAELYQAFFTAWGTAQSTAAAQNGLYDNIPFSLAGAYLWDFDPDSASWSTSSGNYDNYQPSAAALAVIAQNFAAPQPPAVVAETGVAGLAGYQGTPSAASGSAGPSGTGALAGDSDPGGGTLTISAVAGGTLGKAFTTAKGGLLTLNADGSYRYYTQGNTTLGAPVVDTISFTVTSSEGLSTTSTLTITGYRDPVAVTETASVAAGATVTGTAGIAGTGALAGDSDPDGAAVSVGGYYTPLLNVTEPAIGSPLAGTYGTFTINADGSFSYSAQSAALLASAFAATGDKPLVDSVSYIVSGPVGTYARPVSLSVSISDPGATAAGTFAWSGATGAWSNATNWSNTTLGSAASRPPASGDTATVAAGAGSDVITGQGNATVLNTTGAVTLSGSFGLGSAQVGTPTTGSTLLISGSTTVATANVVDGTLEAAGGGLTVTGTLTLGGAAASNAGDYQSLVATGSGHIRAGALTLGLTAGLDTPAYVTVDATSSIEVGQGGAAPANGAIKIDAGALLSGPGTIDAPVVAIGGILATGGLYITGALTGSGAIEVAAQQSIHLSSDSGVEIQFDGPGTATIGTVSGSFGVVGFNGTTSLDLTGVAPSAVAISNATVTAGTATLLLNGFASTSRLNAASDGAGGTLITATPLFDPQYYVANNPSVATSGLDPLTHFLTIGWKEGLNPSALFDTNDYLAANPSVAAAGVDPLLQYTATGAQQGLAAFAVPGTVLSDPLINPAYIYAERPDVKAAGVDATAWWLAYGAQEGTNPDPYFDVNYYETQNPDVKAAGINPLVHFEQFGWKEGRAPSLLFNDQAYLQANPDVAAAGIDPLLHYIVFGQAEGRMAFLTGGTTTADPLVNAAYVDQQLGATLVPSGALAAQQATAIYDSGWQKGINPDAFFNTSYYLAQNPDVAAAGINPLLHYELFGWHEGRNPSPQFSTNRYLAANPDVKAAGLDPLLHYLAFGMNEGRAIYPV